MSINKQLRTIALEPAVKAWLDNVIVPALVREFVATYKSASPVLSGAPREMVACATGERGDKP